MTNVMTMARCAVCLDPYTATEDTPNLGKHFKQTLSADKLCPYCKEKRDNGFVALIAIDPEQSKGATHNGAEVTNVDVKRTGDIAFLEKNIWQQLFKSDIPESLTCFVDPKIIRQLEKTFNTQPEPFPEPVINQGEVE